MKKAHLQGFTLLEMAIVLAIIAAIISGITFGQSLLTSSRLQTVITDADNYTTSAYNFKQLYQALPGDFYNAATVWGTDNIGCTMGNAGASGGGTSGTCQGNGDGKLLNTSSPAPGTLNGASEPGETFLFWQHLKLAGMFSKPISNKAGSGGPYDSTIGTNVPAGSLRGSGFSVYWLGSVTSGDANYFRDDADAMPLSYGNVLYFGSQVSGASTYGVILTLDQASSIDIKIDDGAPGTGKVRAMISTSALNPNCTTTANSTTSLYNTSNTSVLCSLMFVMGF